MATKLDLVNSRGTTIKKLERLTVRLNIHTALPMTLGAITGTLRDLEKWSNSSDDLHEKILAFCKTPADLSCEDDAALDVHEAITTLRDKLLQFQLELTQPQIQPGNGGIPHIGGGGHTGGTLADVKLPRMELPTFSGKYSDWTSFRDLFSSIVHKNQKISGAQKQHYLKNSLQGEPAELIKSIEVSDANYDEAWKLLKDRYENERQIVFAHIRQLLAQQHLKGESATGLRHLLDSTTKHLKALNAHNIVTDNWDPFLVVFLIERLDPESRKQWEWFNPGTDIPKLEELNKFLNQRALALEAFDPTKGSSNTSKPFASHSRPISKPVTRSASSAYHASASVSCSSCKDAHPLFKCPAFNKLDVGGRRELVKKHNLCFNCLAPGHPVGQCQSKSSCRKCNGRHHSMLHWEKAQDSTATATTTTSHLGRGFIRSVLSTALIKIKDASGRTWDCRALLDNGSELSFITENLVQLLGLQRQRSDITVTGIGGDVSGKSHGMVRTQLQSRTSGFTFAPELIILPKLSAYLPQETLHHDWSFLNGYELADPEFAKPGPIDILLGVDVYYDLIKDKTIKMIGNPAIYDTQLGWIVSGSTRNDINMAFASVHVSTIDVQSQLAKFFEIEDLGDKPVMTAEEKECDNHFINTVNRNADGRFVVALPFKSNHGKLGYSKQQALSRLQQVERRLERNQKHKQEYNKFMEEYLAMGHMEPIPAHQRKEVIGQTFYLPHHFVTKETSTSTKFRVVFDGSAKSSTGVSLNSTLHIGPPLQQDIWDILVRFQFPRYVFTADIAKFFRQFSVRPEDRDFQRILWRKDPNQPIEEFRLTTVTYGTAPAPYLASRALLRLAEVETDRFSLAADVIRNSIYVDDAMTGADTEKDILDVQQQLINLLKLAGLPLVKWASNCPAILEDVPPDQRETQLPLQLESEDSVKALGLFWHPAADHFFFKVNLEKNVTKITKRTMLSDVAKLYDPLGWLSPVIIKAKILLQSLWKLQLTWDDDLPPELREEWLRLRTGLFELEKVRIPRRVIHDHEATHQVHGFCDSSQQAYSALVYVRSQKSNGECTTRLICAKTKVAPVKVISIPKLELCGAVLLAKLLRRVSKTITIPVSSIHTWTDSTIVLDWLDALPCKWKVFVANRISEIQGLWPRNHWNHVPSEDNPADCATKGLTALELLDFDLYWYGPNWLHLEPEVWPPPYKSGSQSAPMPEERQNTVMMVRTLDLDLTSRYSSLNKLKRVTAYIHRFLYNFRQKHGAAVSPTSKPKCGPLTPDELDAAFMHWIKLAQHQEFISSFDALQKNKKLPTGMASLRPFIDGNGFLRVGGRLENANLPYTQKHPLLLPAKHQLTKMIIQNEHLRLLHGGGQLVLGSLASNFWIINGKNIVRNLIRTCITCFRFKSAPLHRLMGDLPASRLEPSRPFLRAGIDYGGPFMLKTTKGRGGKIYKSYLALFVCFCTKAVHLELVTDLTTEAFIATLRRFAARRGNPLELYSDNGTNFVGADKELLRLKLFCDGEEHNKLISNYLATHGTKWSFIPPRAPHFGGLWEAGVKSTKTHLRKVIGDTTLTYEEMTTTLCQIEACLNSRPITPMSSDPSDLSALTPGHFLIGEPLTSIPDPNLMELPVNRLNRFQLIQRQVQHFWKRWHRDYLHTLQQRTKWTQPGHNMAIGDLVLVKEDNIPPLKWPLARVVAIQPGKDGQVRVISLKTLHGNLVRDIGKLSRLPLETVEADSSRRGECLDPECSASSQD